MSTPFPRHQASRHLAPRYPGRPTPRGLLAIVLATALAVGATPLTAVTAEPAPEPAAPSLVVSKTSGVDPGGETVTVTGAGFTPTGNLSTRPPVPAGSPAGVYVVFGRFADTWKPSEGAPTAARQSIAQRWAIPGARPPALATNAQWAQMEPDGSFTFEMQLVADDTKEGTYGIATFAGGGAAANPAEELFIPITFAPSLVVSKTSGVDPGGETVTVTGAGFTPTGNLSTRPPVPAGSPAGVYVVFGRFADTWKPSEGAPTAARQSIAQRWAIPGARPPALATNAQWAQMEPDGSFTFEMQLVADDTKEGTYGIATFAGGGAAANPDEELFIPVTFAEPAPEPDPVPGPDPAPGPDPGPGTDPDPDPVVTNGYLDWGVKDAFRTYIRGPIANGSVTTAGGARPAGELFRFPVVEGTIPPGGGAFTARFSGSVRFTGHGGALDLTIANLRVVMNGSSGELVADVTSRGLGSDDTFVFDDVVFADLSSPVGITVAPKVASAPGLTADLTAVLTIAGAQAFAGFYDPGTQLDALKVALGGTASADDPFRQATTTATVALDRYVVQPGEQVSVTASGLLAGEQVEVWMLSSPTWMGTVTADPNGDVAHTFVVPPATPLGDHVVEVRGISSQTTGQSPTLTVVAVPEATLASTPIPPVARPATLPATGLAMGVGFPVAVVLAGLVLVALSRSRDRHPGMA